MQFSKGIGLATALAVSGIVATSAWGQSADALIDKLVEKGILTVKEANELREEADKNFNQAYSTKSGMPEWVSALKFNGDLRGRYEGFYGESEDFVDRSRLRYRLRFGVTATLFENMEVGLRLTSGEPASGGSFGGDPISGNASFQDNGSKKFVYIDLAYAKWSFLNGAEFAAGGIFGKMENPFTFTDMVFDHDYTPEGIALQANYNLNDKHAVRATAGFFLVDEIGGSSQDPFWAGTQVRLESKWSEKVETTAGVAVLTLENEGSLGANVSGSSVNWTVPNQNAGNLRTPVTGVTGTGGMLVNDYRPIVADVGLTYKLGRFYRYSGAFPIKVAGEILHNPGADTRNTGYQAGVTFGKAGKRGLWEFAYRYKHLEGDAWYEEFPDSDFGAYYQRGALWTGDSSGYRPGTNVKGHILRFSYSPFDSLMLTGTAFLTEVIDKSPEDSESGMTRLQLDAVWKF